MITPPLQRDITSDTEEHNHQIDYIWYSFLKQLAVDIQAINTKLKAANIVGF